LFGVTEWFDGNQEVTASMCHLHRAGIWRLSKSAVANNLVMRLKCVHGYDYSLYLMLLNQHEYHFASLFVPFCVAASATPSTPTQKATMRDAKWHSSSVSS